ncbi:hypothetical protein [Haladaptatus sp. DFWS20]|uniref:hypothetical protein n=1 Tax=Haladaptatus sp. DFWS20 TaxID=3403467 RepID=UPI003EBFDD0D
MATLDGAESERPLDPVRLNLVADVLWNPPAEAVEVGVGILEAFALLSRSAVKEMAVVEFPFAEVFERGNEDGGTGTTSHRLHIPVTREFGLHLVLEFRLLGRQRVGVADVRVPKESYVDVLGEFAIIVVVNVGFRVLSAVFVFPEFTARPHVRGVVEDVEADEFTAPVARLGVPDLEDGAGVVRKPTLAPVPASFFALVISLSPVDF